MCVFTQPLNSEEDMTQGQFLSWIPKLKNPIGPIIYP